MTSRTKKLSWIAALGLVPVGSIATYIATGVIKAHGTAGAFEEYKEDHQRFADKVLEDINWKFGAIKEYAQTENENTKEWRINQADFNRRIVDRLDVLLDRIPPRGHTDGLGFGNEDFCFP